MLITLPIAAAEGGFNPLDISQSGGLIWTLVIFVPALFFMWKLVFGPITTAMVERDAKAAEAIVLAQRASEEAEQSRAAVEVALGEAQAESAKLLSQARERAEVRERDILEKAKSESEAMIESARTTIQAEHEKALSAIRNEVVDLSLSAASTVLGRAVNSEDDRRLAADLVTGQSQAGGRG